MRKRKPTPDDRLDWRDPAMPCVRNYRMSNGTTKTIVAPEYEQEWRRMCMDMNTAPSWKDDPTYHMRKDKR